MPVTTIEDNYRLLYAVGKYSAGLAKIDWEEVCKMTGLTKSAATQRWKNIRKAMDVGEGGNEPKPRTGTKKRAGGAVNEGEPGTKKRKAAASVEVIGGEDEEEDEDVIDAGGEGEERV